jgi:hypothetical protein
VEELPIVSWILTNLQTMGQKFRIYFKDGERAEIMCSFVYLERAEDMTWGFYLKSRTRAHKSPGHFTDSQGFNTQKYHPCSAFVYVMVMAVFKLWHRHGGLDFI